VQRALYLLVVCSWSIRLSSVMILTMLILIMHDVNQIVQNLLEPECD
jgi:hypothetical protein